MSWFQCSCGFAIEMLPRSGHVIASASHLHKAARLDGGSTIERMEEIAGRVLWNTVAGAHGDQADRDSASAGGSSRHSTEQEMPPAPWAA